MKREIEIFGIKAALPESAQFDALIALAADHARCWWLDQPTGEGNEMLKAEHMDLQAEAWAHIARGLKPKFNKTVARDSAAMPKAGA